MRILIHWLINAIAIWLAITFVPGISSEGGWVVIAVVAIILGLVNALLRPVLKLLTCPLILLTLGLFTLVINAAMLLITSWIAGQAGLSFHVAGFLPALLGSILISIVNVVLGIFLPSRREEAQLDSALGVHP